MNTAGFCCELALRADSDRRVELRVCGEGLINLVADFLGLSCAHE